MNSSGLPIQVENLTVAYPTPAGDVTALNDLSLTVNPGEFVCITGPSGSGKSTLLHAMCGLRESVAGTVTIGGTALSSLSDAELSCFRRRHIGLVYQFFHLVSSLSVRQNVALPLLMDGASMARVRERVDLLLDEVSLGHRASHDLRRLSGGELQRVAIARALAAEPGIVLADEPTGNLDHRTGDDVMSTLRRLCADRGATVVVVTHDPGVSSFADASLTISDGIVTTDSSSESAEPTP